MSCLDKLLIGAAAVWIGGVAKSNYKEKQETKRRKSRVPQFDKQLPQTEFINIANWIAKHTPRVIGVGTDGMAVLLKVTSNSGLSTWVVEVDFNDYGRLTGNYWIDSENDQSSIPEYFARAMEKEIRLRVS